MRLTRVGGLIFLCLFLLAVDVLLKAYTYFYLPPMYLSSGVFPYGGISVFKDLVGIDFCITCVMNKGAAWGLFSSYQEILLYARLLIVLFMAVYLFVGKMPLVKRSALALIVTGAVGNVIDFFAYGHVIDMFYFNFWGYSYPVFNIADICICVGSGLLLLRAFLEKKNPSLLSSSHN
jgi:signal peptidase II